MNGPTEEDPNYRNDTGSNYTDMQSQVAAYQASMTQLIETVRDSAVDSRSFRKKEAALTRTPLSSTRRSFL